MSNYFIREIFERLEPFERGYACYKWGSDDSYPGIPDENNPFEQDSEEYKLYQAGRHQAMLDEIDGVE